MSIDPKEDYTDKPCAYTAEEARMRAQLKRIKLRYFIDPIIILLGILFVFYVLGQLQAQDELVKQADTNANIEKKCLLDKHCKNLRPTYINNKN